MSYAQVVHPAIAPCLFPARVEQFRRPPATVLEPHELVPGFLAPSDTRAPVVTVISGPSAASISRMPGKDVSSFSFQSDEDFVAYQLRVVASPADPVSAGTLVEQGGGGTAGVAVNVDVTDDELVAAAPGDGPKTVKAFVQDLAGNWSG